MIFLGDLRCLTANMKSRLTEDNKNMNKSVIICLAIQLLCKGKIDEQAAMFSVLICARERNPYGFVFVDFLTF